MIDNKYLEHILVRLEARIMVLNVDHKCNIPIDENILKQYKKYRTTIKKHLKSNDYTNQNDYKLYHAVKDFMDKDF